MFPLKTSQIFFGIFILILSFSHRCLAVESLPSLPQVETYDQLVHEVRAAIHASEKRVEQAVEQEKVREAWEIGKLIDAHVLQYQERADYDQQVLQKLSKDIEKSPTELYYMLRFTRQYPILPAPVKLSWAHYRELLSLENRAERDEMEKEASKEQWSSKELRKEIRARRPFVGTDLKLAPILTAKPGILNTYRIVTATAGPDKGKLVIDLGFSNYYSVSKLKFKDRDIVEVIKGKIKKSNRTESDLYTYPAYVVQVMDGDTFSAVIDLGFSFRTVQTLRLRALDAPEIVSAEGKEAKEALEKMLGSKVVRRQGSKEEKSQHENPSLPPSNLTTLLPVLIRTVKSDKYDRYLADVFVNGEYINQKLVDEGFAQIVEE